MARRKAAYGGGAVANWPVGAAAHAKVPHEAKPFPAGAARPPRAAVDLLRDDLHDQHTPGKCWPVRDQLDRGTCTAFAVVAAEELFRNRAVEPELAERYSEEQLYASMRSVDPRTAGVIADDYLLEETEANGATYLAQARYALVNQGLCHAEVLDYHDFDDPTFFFDPLPDDAVADALDRRVPETDLVHNIINSKDYPWEPGNTHWVRPIKKKVSEIFWRKLKDGIPVVAAFPILEEADWFRGGARNFGKIRYPNEPDDTERPIGGHTVCITGFVPPEAGDRTSGGWFQFRNSLGTRFAYYRDEDTTYPRAMAPGYGAISARDLDDYCWEYLYRSGSSS